MQEDISSNNKILDARNNYVLFLFTYYKLALQRDLWYLRYQRKYTNPHAMVKVCLMRPRFDSLLLLIWFSRQHHPGLEGMNLKQWEWNVANDYVEKLNNHIIKILSPSEIICVVKNVSVYGLSQEVTGSTLLCHTMC